MKRFGVQSKLVVVLVLGMGLGQAVAGEQGQTQGKAAPLPLCPVMGEPIDFTASVATDDGPVFFCCENCIEKYKANPAKYAEKVADQRKMLADRPKVQVTCPVSGKPVDPKVFAEHDGNKIYFCSSMCIGKYQENAGSYKVGLANSYTYQTKCPVMGGAISPKSFSVLPTGQKIYYCCPGCEPKLLAEPAKYAPKLAAQGINIDPKKIAAGQKKDQHDQGHGSHAGHQH